jgi:site-specific recombinase XerD
MNKKFRKILKELNLQGTFHSLRHSFSSFLHDDGVQLKVIAELMGHENMELLNLYIHAFPESKQTAMNNLNLQLDSINNEQKAS